MNNINEVLRKIRQQTGLTQEEFAGKLEMKRNTYATLESGRNNPTVDVLRSIVTIFNIDANVFFGNESTVTVSNNTNNTGSGEDIAEVLRVSRQKKLSNIKSGVQAIPVNSDKATQVISFWVSLLGVDKDIDDSISGLNQLSISIHDLIDYVNNLNAIVNEVNRDAATGNPKVVLSENFLTKSIQALSAVKDERDNIVQLNKLIAKITTKKAIQA